MTKAVTPMHASDHRRGGPDPLPPRAILHIKLFPDLATEEAMGLDLPVHEGIDVFVFMVTKEMNGLCLTKAEGFLSTPGDGDVTVQIRNKSRIDPVTSLGPDLLESTINIPGGEESTFYSPTQPLPAVGPKTILGHGDLIGIDVIDADGTAHGLGVILEFSLPSSIPPEEP